VGQAAQEGRLGGRRECSMAPHAAGVQLGERGNRELQGPLGMPGAGNPDIMAVGLTLQSCPG